MGVSPFGRQKCNRTRVRAMHALRPGKCRNSCLSSFNGETGREDGHSLLRQTATLKAWRHHAASAAFGLSWMWPGSRKGNVFGWWWSSPAGQRASQQAS